MVTEIQCRTRVRACARAVAPFNVRYRHARRSSSFMPTYTASVTATPKPAIRAVLSCDLVASTRLIERVGDATAAELLARHGWYLRTMGLVRESLEESERAYRLDTLDPMSANLVALARMAAGRMPEAIEVYEDRVERVPEMSFPVSSLLRAHALQQDWNAVDELLALAAQRQLRELQDGLPFIRAKRTPPASGSTSGAAHCTRRWRRRAASTYRGSGIRRIWAWSKTRTGLPKRRASVRRAGATTSWVPTVIAHRCCFNTECLNCATMRASHACAHVSGSSSSG